MTLTHEQEKYIEFWFIDGNAATYPAITKYENKLAGYEKYKDSDIEQKYKNDGKIDGWLTEKIYEANTQENRKRLAKDITPEFRKQAQEIRNRFNRDDIKKKNFNSHLTTSFNLQLS